MRFQDLSGLEEARRRAQERYRTAKDSLENLINDEKAFQLAVQEANEAWLEFKKVDVELNNCLIIKKSGELYGC